VSPNSLIYDNFSPLSVTGIDKSLSYKHKTNKNFLLQQSYWLKTTTCVHHTSTCIQKIHNQN